MSGRLHRVGTLLLATAVAGWGTPVHAQGIRVEGRVTQPAGGAAAGQTVLLHQVTPGGGVMLGEALTDADGAFVLTADGPVQPDAVYFVATRLDGQLFIGPMLRPPLTDLEYVLEAGAGATPFDTGIAPAQTPTTLPGGAAGTPRRWFLLVIPLLGVVGVGVWALSFATGPALERRLLIRIARLDNAWERAPGDRDAYDRTRRRLLDQLDAA